MTSTFDRLSYLSKNNNTKYREICQKILQHFIVDRPYWLESLNIYEVTDGDCNTWFDLLVYAKKFLNFLEGRIQDTGYKFLQWVLDDPYYEENIFPFFDNLHDEAHRLARQRIISSDNSMIPDEIREEIELWSWD